MAPRVTSFPESVNLIVPNLLPSMPHPSSLADHRTLMTATLDGARLLSHEVANRE